MKMKNQKMPVIKIIMLCMIHEKYEIFYMYVHILYLEKRICAICKMGNK